MDTKSKAEKILSEIAQSDNSDPLDVAGVCQAYLTQCQEVERLKELLCVAQDYLEQHWDMRSVPLREIDDIANRHLAEAALKDKQ